MHCIRKGFQEDYGQDQGQHGEAEVFGLRTHHLLYPAQQEEGEREAFYEEALQVLQEAYGAQRREIGSGTVNKEQEAG